METFPSDGKLCSRIGKGRAQHWKHFAVTVSYVRGFGKVACSNGNISQPWKYFSVTVSYVRGLGQKVVRSNGNISQ